MMIHTHQASYGDGQVRLFLYRGRRVPLEGQDDRMGVLFYIEPCPSSRYASLSVHHGGAVAKLTIH